jgi:hypothetical protein
MSPQLLSGASSSSFESRDAWELFVRKQPYLSYVPFRMSAQGLTIADQKYELVQILAVWQFSFLASLHHHLNVDSDRRSN